MISDETFMKGYGGKVMKEYGKDIYIEMTVIYQRVKLN